MSAFDYSVISMGLLRHQKAKSCGHPSKFVFFLCHKEHLCLIWCFYAICHDFRPNGPDYCDDHSSLWSTTAVQIYELFHIYFTHHILSMLQIGDEQWKKLTIWPLLRQKSADMGRWQYDKKVRHTALCEGDLVLIRNMTERGGPGKLRSYWEREIYVATQKGRICQLMRSNQSLGMEG